MDLSDTSKNEESFRYYTPKKRDLYQDLDLSYIAKQLAKIGIHGDNDEVVKRSQKVSRIPTLESPSLNRKQYQTPKKTPPGSRLPVLDRSIARETTKSSDRLRSKLNPRTPKSPKDRISPAIKLNPHPFIDKQRRVFSEISPSKNAPKNIRKFSLHGPPKAHIDRENNVPRYLNPTASSLTRKDPPKTATAPSSSITSFPVKVPRTRNSQKSSYTRPRARSTRRSTLQDSRNFKIDTIELLFECLRNHKSTHDIVSNYTNIKKAHVSLSNSQSALSMYEKGEILQTKEVYFVGKSKDCKTQISMNNPSNNFGFDNADKSYIANIGDHLNYRYEILNYMGKGSFGNVISCLDHKNQSVVAIKIIKNEMCWSLQAISEIKMLKSLQSRHPHINNHIVRYLDNFHFRGHVCIVSELLLTDLYQVIQSTSFRGLDLNLIQIIARQFIQSLDFIHSRGIIHCDLKPENIMLTPDIATGKINIKVIDFGSSCKEGQLSYSYLQSRYYRAPEVFVGARYDSKIDIWSMATILVELYTGKPLIVCKDEFELFTRALEYFGVPKRDTIQHWQFELNACGPIINQSDKPDTSKSINKSTILWTCFDSLSYNLRLDHVRSLKPNVKIRGTSVDNMLLRHQQFSKSPMLFMPFLDFLDQCFQWDPRERASARQLRDHRFI
ncbi:hypothetical protein LJB42_003900 [Komagataella kurtzmanii]|nr:hypothetical protein LJB42_003900 [Komagataella kurtzmanii]